MNDSRCLPVCLRDVKPSVRIDAAKRWARLEPQDGAAVFAAAISPSPTIYWVRETARDQLAKIKVAREDDSLQVAA